MHLMRWQQHFPQIFLCSYPFPVYLKSIFIARASWKVVQSKTKFTLLIYVKSEEDDPLGPTPLDIYLLYYLLRGIFPCFRLLGRIIIKEWGSSPTQRLKFSPPQFIYLLLIKLQSILNYTIFFYKRGLFVYAHNKYYTIITNKIYNNNNNN